MIPRREFIRISLASLSTPFLTPLFQGGQLGELRGEVPPDGLFRLFEEPPDSARPFVRWWWNGDRLSEEEIVRELDVMKKAGIGGVEINPIRFPDGADPVGYESIPWLSDEWIEMLRVALEAARDRDITCDIIVGSGWPFGGEFLEREEQTQLLAVEAMELAGPGTFHFSRVELLDRVDPEVHSRYDGVYKEIREIRLVPAVMEEFDPGISLDDRLSEEEFDVVVPEGKFVLYYLTKLTGFQAVINGAPGAAGPVLNHYHEPAVRKYLDRMSARLSASIGVPGDHFRAMFCDSLELEGANWVDDLPEEFHRRRGYDLRPYLPFVLYKIGHMGNPVEEAYGSRLGSDVEKVVRRVRYDFYITRLELFKERFIDPFNEWCHRHGVRSRVQAYGRGYHPLDASGYVDIPECETWLRKEVGYELPPTGDRGRAYSMINKFVASGARLAGKKLVSCEEITNTSMVFNATLENIKVAGDQSNLSGVTHSILHGFNYSPPEAPFPGWVQYGTYFNEKNPWWPYFRLWADYKARLSAVFLAAEPCADIAILHPLADLWMKYGPQRDPFPVVEYPEYQHNVWEAVHQNGFGCDYVSEKILNESEFENGNLVYGTRKYSSLILLEVETILPETAGALERFADTGGRIIFVDKTPDGSPGYRDHEDNDRKVREAVGRILGKHRDRVRVHPAPGGNLIAWFRDLAKKSRLQPYVGINRPNPMLSQVRFQNGDQDIFFFSHYDLEKSCTVKAAFDVRGKTPWIWDPESGRRRILKKGRSLHELTLSFGPAESKLIVFERLDEGDMVSEQPPSGKRGRILTGSWKITLDHVDGLSREGALEKLTDLSQEDQWRHFAGTICYQKEVRIQNALRWSYIDLGRVHGVSRVFVNGKLLGTGWYGEHRYALGNTLRAGGNTIEIQITTTLGNYLKSLEDNPVARRWTARQDYQPMGLIGPVRWI